MSREHALLRILAANASIQRHVSFILEAKAKELEKSRNWTCRHFLAGHFDHHEQQLKESLKMHEQVVEILDGITKVESGLARHLHAVLGTEQGGEGMAGGAGLGGMGGLFDFGGDAK